MWTFWILAYLSHVAIHKSATFSVCYFYRVSIFRCHFFQMQFSCGKIFSVVFFSGNFFPFFNCRCRKCRHIFNLQSYQWEKAALILHSEYFSKEHWITKFLRVESATTTQSKTYSPHPRCNTRVLLLLFTLSNVNCKHP